MRLLTRKMAKFDVFRPLFAFQLIFVTIGIISIKADILSKMKSIGGTMARSIAMVPSKIADGSQYTTQRVARTMRSIKPIEGIVDKTCGPISNILGTSSRMLGKTVKNPQEVVFLYGRIHKNLGKSHPYQGLIKEVIGYVLTNVILYSEDMADSEPVEIANFPVLSALIGNYKTAGATPTDIYHLVKLLSRNGKQDIPKELADKMENYSIMTDNTGKFKTSKGLMDELRWIGLHSNGFYKVYGIEDEVVYETNKSLSTVVVDQLEIAHQEFSAIIGHHLLNNNIVFTSMFPFFG